MDIVLAPQFGAFLQPFIIMLALLITGKSLDMTAMIGIIVLMGIVTKNAILLVDFANVQRRWGMSVKKAILTAGLIRLRPVLMTILALILGIMPCKLT